MASNNDPMQPPPAQPDDPGQQHDAVVSNNHEEGQQEVGSYTGIIIVGVVAGAIIFFGSLLAYLRHWDATGIPSKNLWDWATLLIIPLVLAYGGIWLSQIQQRRERQTEVQRQRRENEVEVRQKNQEKQWDFLRRVRKVEVEIEDARGLMIANNSGKTWVEQMLRLRRLNREMAEILEDLTVVPSLFTKQPEICEELQLIKQYLQNASNEYSRKVHEQVDSLANGMKLTEIVKDNSQLMQWTNKFIDEKGNDYENECSTIFKQVKTKMGEDIFQDQRPVQADASQRS